MQSKVLTLLSFAQMWKYFSHFGVRTLLVLYLVKHLQYSDAHAFGVNAVFCGLVELGGIFGGIIADRYLGLRRAMIWGGWILAIGYFSLLFEHGLFLAMGCLIAGGALFSSNITALLGLTYIKDDPKRKKGFTIFYMMQNLGALLSTALCGFIAIHYGFRWGFAVASSGMIIANLTLFLRRGLLQNLGTVPQKKHPTVVSILLLVCMLVIGTVGVASEKIVMLFLPWITGGLLVIFGVRLLKDAKLGKEIVYKLFIYLAGLILFFAVEDQICSSLLLFAERETERRVFGWTLPSGLITSLNPIIILVFGAVIAKRKTQVFTPFGLTSVSFGILAVFCLLNLNFSLFGVMGVGTVISIAELMIGPLVYS